MRFVCLIILQAAQIDRTGVEVELLAPNVVLRVYFEGLKHSGHFIINEEEHEAYGGSGALDQVGSPCKLGSGRDE